MTSTRLHPTPTRLRYLADTEAGRLPERLTTAMYDLLAAGWIEADGVVGRWRITALGRAYRVVRIVAGADHMVAECGDPDEPRVLGDAILTKHGRQWLICARPLYAVGRTKHEAREELLHMAAAALANDNDFNTSTDQEGPTA